MGPESEIMNRTVTIDRELKVIAAGWAELEMLTIEQAERVLENLQSRHRQREKAIKAPADHADGCR